MSDKVHSVVGGLFWSFAEKIASQLMSTIISLILARLLLPEHYGLVTIVTVLISFFNVFVTGGFNTALVQKKYANDTDFNSAFVLTLILSIVIYIILFFTAPYISKYYSLDQLTKIIRVMSIRLPIAAVNSIQQAYIQRKMMFKRFFFSTLFGTVISGIVGISLAFLNYGVWALVAQYLINVIINTIVLLIVDEWHPRFEFSSVSTKEIWSFSWKVLCTNMVFTLSTDVRSLAIGKVFGTADLAYYDQGKKYPTLIVNNVVASINSVILPSFSKEQSNYDVLKGMLRRAIGVGCFALTPLLLGFVAIARSFVLLLLNEAWLPCVAFIRIFCIMYLTRPLESACHQALLAIGKSGTVLYCMIAIDGTGLILALFSILYLKSVICVAYSSLISTLISIIVFMYCTKKNFNYGLIEQIHDIYKSLIAGILMLCVVTLIETVFPVSFLSFIIQILTGAFTYFLFSFILKNESFFYIIKLLRSHNSTSH